MTRFRATLRYLDDAGRQRYHVDDVSAATLPDALRALIERLPDTAGAADLLEVRRQAEPDQREYGPE